jgi:MFS family permease
LAFDNARARTVGPSRPAEDSGVSLLRAFVALKHRDYRVLWFSQLFSFMGMQMQQVARGLLAYQLTGSYTMVGVTMMAWGIPQLAFSLIGGAVADRVNKRNVILVSQTGTGVLSLLNAVLITTGQISIPWLFGLGLVQGTLFAFNMPARQALVAELVPRSMLMNAIALNNVGMNATRIVGPAAAGLMIGFWGVESAYYAQAFMLLFVVGLTLLLPPSTGHLAGAERRGGIFTEIALGLKFIGSSRTLLVLMLMAFVPTLLGMPYVSLLPGFAVAELGLKPGAYGLMFTVTGVGAIVGSLGIAALTEFPRKPLLQAGVGLGFGLALAGLGLGAIFFGYSGALIALLAVGLFSTTYQTLNNTMIMAETRPEFYGRVMSVYMLTFSLFPLMSGPMGVVADLITAKTTFIVLGAGITAFIVLTTLLNGRYTFSRSRPRQAGDDSSPADAAPGPSYVPATSRAPLAPAGPISSRGPAVLVRRAAYAPRDYMGLAPTAPPSRDYMRGGAGAGVRRRW